MEKQEIIIDLEVAKGTSESDIEEITAGVWEELNRIIKASYPNVQLIDVEAMPRGRSLILA